MSALHVEHLSKNFKIPQKEPGLSGTLKSFVSRKYVSREAVNDISFEIGAGELIGFIGPNGAGKTTTLKMLSGLLFPSSGKVCVLGFTPFERKHQFLKQIALVMGQKNQLWWDLPASDTFLLNKEIYEIPERQYQETLGALVNMLDVADVLATPVKKLSLGQRMKMELIAALLHRPKILFLDEPTIGLDVVMQQAMREFIARYNQESGATIILTSHYMDDVKKLCKRVIMIDHGVKMYDGPLDKLVATHAAHKKITVTLEQKLPLEKLNKLAPVSSYEFPTVIFEVPRESSTTVAGKLLKRLKVIDVNIEEPQIEDIIRDVFMEKRGGV